VRTLAAIASLAVLLSLSIVPAAVAGTTAKVGGPGGSSTVVMDCGSSAFIVGVTAEAGKDEFVAPNVLRRVKFTCRAFSGTSPASSTTQTREAVASARSSYNSSRNSVLCSQDRVIHNLELYAGLYVDRIATADCRTSSSSQAFLNVNVGGDGGSRKFLECPNGEGLYKVEARVGSAIDSLKGTCRAFGAAAEQPLTIQIQNSLSPKPTYSSPVKILPGAAKTFSFKISGTVNVRTKVGIASETDLLGGGSANPPDFKLEILNPAGNVVASRTVLKAYPMTVQSVTVTINSAGTWKLRVTNLKRSYGALDVTGVYGGGPP
jgi:hypothetical protein